MADLAKLSAVKAYLGLASDADDVLLKALIARTSDSMRSWLGRDITLTSYTDTFDGNNGAVLTLPNYPVVSVFYVKINGNAVPQANSYYEPGWRLAGDRILLNTYRFYKGHENVEVSYCAGYAEAPEDLQYACVEWVAHRYKQRDRIGLASKSAHGENTTYSVKDVPESVVAIMHLHKDVIPG